MPAGTRSLRVGNVYGHGFDGGQRERLEAAGFRLRPATSRYPGAQLCSFLDFGRGPALELIEVEDEHEYLDFLPPGMEPYCPGISLVAADNDVEPADVEHELRDLAPYRLHVAYDGSDDPAAPGWRYVNVATPVTPGTFTWFTAFDDPHPRRSYPTAHPNGALGVAGLVFDLPIGRLRRLAALAGATLGEDGFRIGELDVWTRPEAAALPRREKVFPLTAVVVEAPSTEGLAYAEDAVELSFRGAPAVLLRTAPRCWDVVVRTATPG